MNDKKVSKVKNSINLKNDLTKLSSPPSPWITIKLDGKNSQSVISTLDTFNERDSFPKTSF